jgi:hypothetical protein
MRPVRMTVADPTQDRRGVLGEGSREVPDAWGWAST